MRNLKRALSLALAFIMVMGLMIVGTSAKSYTDADKIDNQVAVEILGEIGVMVGNDDGSFAPDRDVTRAEMAVILTRILYGENLNVDQFKGMNTFTDVPDWAEGFVNLCASLDIIAGRGNGIFDPDATVTTAEAALMLARVLGYFKNNAEFGSDWALASVKRATQLGIIGGDMVLQANEGLDRDNVALMTFNTLTKTVPVQYNELLDVYYNVNQGVIYALEFNYLQTLGYTKFDLVYKSNQAVEYGRPATTWGTGSYVTSSTGTASGIEKAELTPNGGLIASNVRMLAKDEIITVVNDADYVYDKDTKEKDVYADLGATVCNDAKADYDWTVYVNGKEVEAKDDSAFIPEKNESAQYAYTDKGSVTEIYVDDVEETVTVVEINYYLGQVSKVVDDVATVRPLSHEGKILDDRTFTTSEFEKGDYVVFTVDYNTDDEYYICELMAPETMTGEVTRVQNDKDSNNTYVRLDGESTQYYYTATPTHMVYDVSAYDDTYVVEHPSLNKEYVFYMTPAGYILGFELAEKTEPEYLYVTDSDEEMLDWVAKVILADATQPKVDVDGDLANTAAYTIDSKIEWLTAKVTNIDELIWDYTVDSNGVYSLTYIPELNKDGVTVNSALYQNELYGMKINNGESYMQGADESSHFIIDKSTIFVDTMNDVAYTGYNEVPDIENAHIAYVVEDGVAQIVYIFDGDIYDENSIYFMLTSTDRDSLKYDGDYYWEYFDAYVDGKQQTLTVSYDAVSDMVPSEDGLLIPGVLYQVVKSLEDGKYITEIRYAGPETNNVISVGDDSFRISTLPAPTTTVNSEKYDVDDETVFVLVEYVYYNGKINMEISKGGLDDMFVGKDHEGYQVYADVVESDGQTADLVYLTYCKPIVNCDVNVEVEHAEVTILGNHIDKTFDKDGYFQVQAFTPLFVSVKADEGYAVNVNGELMSEYCYVTLVYDDTVIAANAVATEAQVTKAGDYSDKVDMLVDGKKVESTPIDAENGTTVVLYPEAGYTITAVEAGNVKASVNGKVWTVNVPAGSEDVVLNLTIEPDQYAYTTADDNFTIIVENNPDKLTIGETYTVYVTSKVAADTWNNYSLKANGEADGVTKVDFTNGVTMVPNDFSSADAAEAYFAHGGTVYVDEGCTHAYANTDQIQAGKTWYYKDVTEAFAEGEYTFTVSYVEGGTIAFTMA